MGDLIYRDDAITALTQSADYIGDALDRLCKVPAVDAVPVIRCRDCKYGEPDTNGNGEDMVMCHYKQNPIGFEYWLMPPEWFCADGERRDSE